jgi:Holliday junction DNA helicase RuvA
MISYIEGLLTEKNPAYSIIECGGIGYLLNISLNTYSTLPDVGQKCRLFTHLVIKSEVTTPVGLLLFGFATDQEREVFINLVSVSGVGNNTARLILSSLTTEEVISAIVTNRVDIFQKVKGIGAKTAQKLILDLKDKFEKRISGSELLIPSYNKNKEEALTALVILGFQRNNAEKALDKVLKAQPVGLSVEQLIKSTLQIL